MYDIAIIGASFAGLTLALHLPREYKIIILDKKKKLDAGVESTGLITEVTRNLIADFFNVDQYITNKITTIGVVSPDYNKYFFSATAQPWIYSTDTPALLAGLAGSLPENITLKLGSNFTRYEEINDDLYPVKIFYRTNGDNQESEIKARFIVGADGANSVVARSNLNLSKNKKFLAGLEKVYFGHINFGPQPDSTVYHLWFGEFSLGYGGWLSPTIVNNQPAFRVGLAKLGKDINDLKKVDDFIRILVDKGIINIQSGPHYTFGSLIPIGGVLKTLYDKQSLLIGDAAGFCGAFAADGIKGAVVSGQVAAKLIPQFLNGQADAFEKYKMEMQSHYNLMTYYRKQQFYRFVWNRIKRNETFHSMYDLIAKQKDDFLYQFCDSKDKARSLVRNVVKIQNIPALMRFAGNLIFDLFKK